MKLFNDMTPGGRKMTTFEAQDGLLATLEGPKISYINVDIDSDPLIIKSMLLARATATILFTSVIGMFFLDFSVFNRNVNSHAILKFIAFQVRDRTRKACKTCGVSSILLPKRVPWRPPGKSVHAFTCAFRWGRVHI